MTPYADVDADVDAVVLMWREETWGGEEGCDLAFGTGVI